MKRISLLAIGSALLTASLGCAGSTNPRVSTTTSSFEDAIVACVYPADAAPPSDGSGPGCYPGPSERLCTGSDARLSDGGLATGSTTCVPFCSTSEYEMTCRTGGSSSSIPDPASSLGCTIIPIPTPESEAFYCCPCAG